MESTQRTLMTGTQYVRKLHLEHWVALFDTILDASHGKPLAYFEVLL